MKRSITSLLFCLLHLFYGSLQAGDRFEESFQQGIEEVNYFQTPLNYQLRYTHFRTPHEECHGSVLLLQGRGTFLEFYEELITPLLERGFDVWMYDLSGQGGSERLLDHEIHGIETAELLQHISSFDHYVNDADAFIEEVLLPQAKAPLYLSGYSTGGHVGLRWLQTHPHHFFDKAFFISPLINIKAPLSNSTLSYLLWGATFFVSLETYAPGTGPIDPIFISSFEGNGYTSDPDSFLQLQTLCHLYKPYVMGGISLGWLCAAIDSIDSLWQEKQISQLNIPIFIATGGDDTIVDVSQNELFSSKLSNGYHACYPRGRHELFREAKEIRLQLHQDLDQFIFN